MSKIKDQDQISFFKDHDFSDHSHHRAARDNRSPTERPTATGIYLSNEGGGPAAVLTALARRPSPPRPPIRGGRLTETEEPYYGSFMS